MNVVTTSSGASYVYDVWKGSLGTVEPSLRILDRADAGRRIAVLGFIRHDLKPEREIYEEAITVARRHADLVLLVGPAAAHAPAEPTEELRAFETLREAGEFLRDTAGSDDFILLRSKNALHVDRVALFEEGDVTCARDICFLPLRCADCRELRA